MRDLVAGVLLLLDVLLLALVVVLVARALVRLVRRLLARRRSDDMLVLRRCDACRRGWRGQPGVDYGLGELLVRRRARRKARAAPRVEPAWAKARGWSRCPSCLSTRVRTSGEEPDPDQGESRLSLEALGYLLTGAGLLLLVGVAAVLAGT